MGVLTWGLSEEIEVETDSGGKILLVSGDELEYDDVIWFSVFLILRLLSSLPMAKDEVTQIIHFHPQFADIG